MTTPLTLLFYPPRVRARLEIGQIDAASESDKGSKQVYIDSSAVIGSGNGGTVVRPFKSRLTVVLERVDQLPGVMSIVQLFNPPASAGNRTISVDALRLVELTDRASAVMRGSEPEDLLRRDAIAKVFKTFSKLNRIAVSSLSLTVVPQSGFSETVTSFAKSRSADLIVLPWSITQGAPSDSSDAEIKPSHNPLQHLFGLTHASSGDESVQYSHFIRQVFSDASSDVGLLVEREREEIGTLESGYHLVVPFFGGPDDRLAVEVAVGLAKQNRGAISATIVRITRIADDATSVIDKEQCLENLTKVSAPVGLFSFSTFTLADSVGSFMVSLIPYTHNQLPKFI